MEGISAELVTTARSLATDAACREVVRAWRARGVPSILLKGATTAQWLYPDAARGYTDADLLVAPARVLDAAAVLAELGFVPVPEHVSGHAHPWIRSTDGATIDLHVTMWGPGREPDWVWRELQNWIVPFAVGGETVQALDLPARALHITLHAAQHRDAPRQPEDLRRLLGRATLVQWRGAERLADRLWALGPMAIGLGLAPDGASVLARLPLVRAAATAETEGARLAVGFARLANAPRRRDKLAVLSEAIRSAAAEPGPDPDRPRSLLARGAACARRAGWLLTHAPATAIALRRQRAHTPDADGRTPPG